MKFSGERRNPAARHSAGVPIGCSPRKAVADDLLRMLCRRWRAAIVASRAHRLGRLHNYLPN